MREGRLKKKPDKTWEKVESRKVEISLKLLDRIATYYEFPMVAFFTPAKYLKGTRREYLKKRWTKRFKQIDKLITKIKGVLDE